MNGRSCDAVRGMLVEYADGVLAADETAACARHIAVCTACADRLAALQGSLVIARDLWAKYDRVSLPAEPCRVAPAVRPRRAARLAVAAAAVIALGVFVWRLNPADIAPGAPAAVVRAPIDDHEIESAVAAAQLLAQADELARMPGGDRFARTRYEQVVRYYPATRYAADARLRLSTVQEHNR